MPRGGRNVPGLQQRWALKGKLLVKKYKGKLVVQSWPKPYGKARSEAQANTQLAFKRFQRAVKFFPPQQIITAMELTKGTGMYPRDLMMAASLGTNVMLGYDEPGALPMIGDGLQKFTAIGGETIIDWQNIPPGYSGLMIDILARSNLAANQDTIGIQFNGDTAAHYDINAWNRNGTFSAVAANIGLTSDIPAATSPANYAGGGRMIIPGYSNTAFYKYVEASGADFHSVAVNQFWLNMCQTWWRSKVAISRVELILNAGFAAGSTATLYGLF